MWKLTQKNNEPQVLPEDNFVPQETFDNVQSLSSSSGLDGGAVTGTRWVETEDAAHQPTKTTEPPQQRIIWPQMVIVPR